MELPVPGTTTKLLKEKSACNNTFYALCASVKDQWPETIPNFFRLRDVRQKASLLTTYVMNKRENQSRTFPSPLQTKVRNKAMFKEGSACALVAQYKSIVLESGSSRRS